MIEDYYISGFTVLRESVTNEGGISSSTFTEIANIKARLRPLSGREIYQNDKVGYETTDRIYCGIFDIKSGDVLLAPNGKYYEIKVVRDPMSLGHHLEIDCQYKEDFQNY